jgi:pilus assembly protein CpaB
MNRRRLFLIAALALALAGFTSVLVFKLMNANLVNAKGPTTTVVVAAIDLDAGSRLEEKDLRLVKLPSGDLPDGYFQTATEIVGRGVIVPIFKNDLVLTKKLAAEKAGSGLPSMIPAGMRAVSVKVNDVVNVAGFAVPGTRVDVLVTGNPEKSNDPGAVTTTTVLENVQVLTAGDKLQQNSDPGSQNFPVITLLVSPQDAQKLTLASMEGRIQLALRNPLDTDTPSPAGLKNAMLYGKVAAPAPRKREAKAVAAPAAIPVYTVELIRGDKRDVAKF